MGIIDKLRSLFVREKPTKQPAQSTNITRYDTSSIIIPKYSELSEEDRAIVDGYISEIDMERLETLTLYADEMSRYATANTDLLVKLFERITERPLSEFELSKLSDTELYETRLDTLIQREQIGLYRHGLQALERESALRATALVEIARRENKRKFDFLGLFGRAERIKRKSQTELLQLVIERMKISKKTIEQQIQAVSNAEQTETTVASSIEVYNAITKTDETVSQTVLQQRVADILQMASLVIPEAAEILKEINDNTPEDQIVRRLAIVQRKLDVYAYTHRKEIEQLRQEILEIGQLEKTTERREELLRRINQIQTMYKVFAQYVTPEDLQSLYQAKFDVLITGIYEQEESPFVGITDKDELAYYASIIQDKLETLLKGTHPYFINYFGENESKAIKIIKDILKAENQGFSAERILENKRLLSFVLAFDTERGFDNFFYDTKAFNEADLVEHLDNGTIEWEDNLPLKTICELERIVGNLDKKSTKKISPWVNLVLISKLGLRCRIGIEIDQLEYGEWSLPEGIRALSFSCNDLYTNPYEHRLVELLRETPDHVRVVCPSTLKKIKSPEYLSSPRNSTEIELNEGLEEIDAYAFRGYGFRRVFFPASLNKIRQGAFSDCQELQEITFNEGLREIGDGAFMGCTELIRVEFPSTLRVVGSKAFEGCEALAEIYINEGIETIGQRAFANCPNLRTISVPTHKLALMGDDAIEIISGLQKQFRFKWWLNKDKNVTLRIRGSNIEKSMLEQYKQILYEPPEITYNYLYEEERERESESITIFNRRIKNIEVIEANAILLTYEINDEQSFDVVCDELLEQIQNRKNIREER